MITTLIAPLLIATTVGLGFGVAPAPAAVAQTPDCPQTGQTSACQQQTGHPSIYSGYTGPGDGMHSGGGFGGFVGAPLAPPVFPMG